MHRWKAEAEAQGWTLIEKIDGARARYRHGCGHEQEAEASNMRKGAVRCQGCANPLNRWEEEAEAQGWLLVEKIDGMRARYRHACGHEQEVSASNMRKGNVRCKGCANPLDRWEEEAEAQGWILIEKIDGARARYRHACGHEQEAQAANMRNGSVRCGGCANPLDRWKAEAEAQGWILIEKIDGARARYRHACGHEQEAQAANMRNGSVRCGGCSKG